MITRNLLMLRKLFIQLQLSSCWWVRFILRQNKFSPLPILTCLFVISGFLVDHFEPSVEQIWSHIRGDLRQFSRQTCSQTGSKTERNEMIGGQFFEALKASSIFLVPLRFVSRVSYFLSIISAWAVIAARWIITSTLEAKLSSVFLLFIDSE